MARRCRSRCVGIDSWILFAAALVAMVASATGHAQTTDAVPVDFVKQIQPIFKAKCDECHGAELREAGLRLDSRRAAFTGGDSGVAIIPGNADKSLLLQAVARTHEDSAMPPEDEGTPLSAVEVSLIRRWIDEGAKWPEGVDGVAGSNRAGSDHWAFQPLKKPPIPESSDPWIANPIDSFVLQRLTQAQVKPASEAQSYVLIRRLFLDLTGLLPTPDELATWRERASQGDGWYEQLVDTLLASPHYGERWGRHWLDLARYADSDGYEKDRPRPFAWRWRDWVIKAVNDDMPFDQFTIEQLAGDLLPNATLDQITATGFHRNTLTNREGGVDQEEYRVKAVKDRVYTTGTVWLGLTLQCGECHSHKFDPFTQREYYQLAAFFNNADEKDLVEPLPGEVEAYEQALAKYEQRERELQASLAEATRRLADRQSKWEDELSRAETAARAKLPADVRAAFETVSRQRSDEEKEILAKYYRGIDSELKTRQTALESHRKKKPKRPGSIVAVFAERSQPRDNYVHQRGDFRRPGDRVDPAPLAALNPFHPRGERPDRLDLARWLVDPANPLTPRVAVNRIWQHLFGRGIVETTWDFGTQGAPPTHPELLDWLAGEYIERGWSRKAMIKLIVMSATYRQSSATRSELLEGDPKNDLLARQNRFRLDAEIVRDLYLGASGLLHRAVGGPSVYPPLPADVAALGYAGSVKWRESKAPQKYRRGMYIFFRRSVPYPMLTTFDAPESNVVSTRRDRSNTPLQSLTLLNDPVFVDCSRALSRRVLGQGSGSDTAERLKLLYRLCLAREPDRFELSRLTQLHDRLLAEYRADPKAAGAMSGGPEEAESAVWTVLSSTVMNLDEFVTRE